MSRKRFTSKCSKAKYLRLFPPLNVTEGDINKAIEILEEAFDELKI